MNAVRLIVDPPQAGDWNMAVDEALLGWAAAGNPTLRFYQWSEPTLSLGYFQSHGQRAEHLASRSCVCVRRSSGGGAILHDRELTYSFTAGANDCGFSDLESVYGIFHESLVRLLYRSGLTAHLSPTPPQAGGGDSPPFLCFKRRARGDVLLGEHKICGSAQRRQRLALLQHGSVVLKTSSFAPEILGIEDISGQRLSTVELVESWCCELAAAMGVEWQPGQLSLAELRYAEGLRTGRFGAPSWLMRR